MVAVMGFEPNITSVKEMCPNLLDDTAVYGAGERNRTLKDCLQGSCFTIINYASLFWWDTKDLNLYRTGYEPGALPLS